MVISSICPSGEFSIRPNRIHNGKYSKERFSVVIWLCQVTFRLSITYGDCWRNSTRSWVSFVWGSYELCKIPGFQIFSTPNYLLSFSVWYLFTIANKLCIGVNTRKFSRAVLLYIRKVDVSEESYELCKIPSFQI